MLASIESFFIFLVIAGASALFNWFKKRNETQDDWTGSELPPEHPAPLPHRQTPPPVAQPQKKSTNWEEELRRMLEGTVPTTRTPPPPPIVVQERKPVPTAPPAPMRPSEPTMFLPKSFAQKFYKAHCNYCDGHIEFPSDAMDEVVSCPHCHRQTVLRPFEATRVETITHQKTLTELTTSAQKYDAASRLSQRVAAHMHDVGQRPVETTSIEVRTKAWPEVAETVALFKNAKTARRAVIASLILGPPKSLEN